MTNFNSLTTIDQANLNQYWSIVQTLEPEFYLLRIALEETGVNPMIIPKVIRAINNLAIGTGYGKIQIFMTNGKVTQIRGEESDNVEEDALIDK